MDNYRDMFESRMSAGGIEKILIQRNLKQTFPQGPMTWKVMKCVERYCELARLHVLTTINSKEEEIGSVGELSKVCSQIVLKCLYLARIGRPDILWSFKQYCHVGNSAQQCKFGLFQDFASDVEDSKSSGIVCIFGSHTFVPTSWMCKKQTSVSHSSTEVEIISLDAGLRVDGIPALDLWNLVIEVFHYSY